MLLVRKRLTHLSSKRYIFIIFVRIYIYIQPLAYRNIIYIIYVYNIISYSYFICVYFTTDGKLAPQAYIRTTENGLQVKSHRIKVSKDHTGREGA